MLLNQTLKTKARANKDFKSKKFRVIRNNNNRILGKTRINLRPNFNNKISNLHGSKIAVNQIYKVQIVNYTLGKTSQVHLINSKEGDFLQVGGLQQEVIREVVIKDNK